MNAIWKAALVSVLFTIAMTSAASDYVERQLEAFRNSDFELQRAGSNVPFPPIAFLDVSHYGQAKVDASDRGAALDYDVTSFSQALGVPFLLGNRDAVIVGEYVSHARFRLRGSATDQFDIDSIGIPLGWIRQANPRWQVAAFVMPLGHQASFQGNRWSWQYMGGIFSRYVQNDELWWAFGAYADIAPGDDFYIPYVGASWSPNVHWTLSAVMPWPSVLYAPNRNWLLSLGVSPSAASWSITPETRSGAVALNLDAWDLGATLSRRISGGFWGSIEAGVGGFRGLRVVGSDISEPSVDVGSSAFISLELSYRPGLD